MVMARTQGNIGELVEDGSSTIKLIARCHTRTLDLDVMCQGVDQILRNHWYGEGGSAKVLQLITIYEGGGLAKVLQYYNRGGGKHISIKSCGFKIRRYDMCYCTKLKTFLMHKDLNILISWVYMG